MPRFFQQLQKPVHRSKLASIPTRDLAGERGIKLPYFVTFVLEGLLDQLAGLGIQHRDALLSRMQINAYNSHLGLLRLERC